MPTPIGHGLAAVAAGWAVARPARDRHTLAVQVLTFAAIGTIPDLDIFIDRHRGESHSVGAAIIAATILALVRWPIASSRARIWLAVWAAWMTHPLLDALALDKAVPLGIMAFWPFSHAYMQTGLELFLPVSRSVHSPTFLPTARLAATRELLILVPIIYAIWRWRARARVAPELHSPPHEPSRNRRG